MSACVSSASPAGVVAMSISHMPKSTSIMQGLPHHHHHHLQSSLVQNNLFGMDNNGHRNTMDDPNPDMLLALIARNKALEGMCIYFNFFINIFPLILLSVLSKFINQIHAKSQEQKVKKKCLFTFKLQ